MNTSGHRIGYCNTEGDISKLLEASAVKVITSCVIMKLQTSQISKIKRHASFMRLSFTVFELDWKQVKETKCYFQHLDSICFVLMLQSAGDGKLFIIKCTLYCNPLYHQISGWKLQALFKRVLDSCTIALLVPEYVDRTICVC